MSTGTCIRCGRVQPVDELIAIAGGELVDEACLAADAKAEERRDSIDDALASLRAAARDGTLMVDLDIAPRGPIGIDLRYYRVGTTGPAAEIATHGNVATVAKTMRELATVIAGLPDLVSVGET